MVIIWIMPNFNKEVAGFRVKESAAVTISGHPIYEKLNINWSYEFTTGLYTGATCGPGNRRIIPIFQARITVPVTSYVSISYVSFLSHTHSHSQFFV